MTDKRPRIERLATLVSEIRHEVAGTPLTVPDTSEWRATVFSDLVSDLYKWFREEWGREISYLTKNAVTAGVEAGDVRRFDSILNDLRTSQQHHDTEAADKSKERWLRETIGVKRPSDPDDWGRACDALIAQCEHAVEALVALARAIKADGARGSLWRQAVEAESRTNEANEVSIVLGDLGVSVNRGTQSFLVRRAKANWSHRRQALTASDSVEQEIEHVVERLVVGHLLEPLPCSYNDVLEALGVEPGTRQVLGLLLLAHGAATLFEYATCDEFLQIVEEQLKGFCERE